MKTRHMSRRGTTVNGIHYNTIADHAELLSWFDHEKNVGLDPATIPIRSMDKIWMRCPKCKHSVFTSPYRKFRNGNVRMCISCGIGREVNNFDQRNSFGKVYPEFVKYWDYEKNEDTPFDVTAGSNFSRWFKCRVCNTSHLKVVNTFPIRAGCAKCVHQLETSFGEQALYFYLKKEIPGIANGDRTEIAPYEIDILVPETNPTGVRTAIEYCGSVWHEKTYEKMFKKYAACKEHGLRLLVIWEKKNTETVPDLDKCSDWHTSNDTARFMEIMERSIVETCAQLGVHPDVDLKRDRDEILKMMHTYKVFDSVADDPLLSKIWMYEMNSVDPATVYKTSHTRFWFRCPTCGKEKFVSCDSAFKYHKCPNCNGHKRTEMWTEDGKTLITKWNSAREASNKMNFSYEAILEACAGKYKFRTGGHVFHGYYWKFSET